VKADFHIHSTASDGVLPPREIVKLATARGLEALALTDHDSVNGVPEALEAAADLGIFFIPGIEISTRSPHYGDVHILGYYIRTESRELEDFLERQRRSREERLVKILHRLRELGFVLEWEEVGRIAGDAAPGRPHVAQAMVARGYVSSVREAFVRFLERGAAAYIPREKPSPEEAIAAIRGAGGIAFLAHPWEVLSKGLDLADLIARLKDKGLGGLEAFYDGYSREQGRRLTEIASRFDLLISGGSDFHGLETSDTPIGGVDIPEEEVRKLISLGKGG